MLAATVGQNSSAGLRSPATGLTVNAHPSALSTFKVKNAGEYWEVVCRVCRPSGPCAQISYAVTAGGEEVPSPRFLPRGVRFVRTPGRPVTFHSRGGAAPAGTFELGVGGASARVVVSVGGRVRWEWREME